MSTFAEFMNLDSITNSEEILTLLSESLGSVFNTLSPDVIERMVIELGDMCDESFNRGQENMMLT